MRTILRVTAMACALTLLAACGDDGPDVIALPSDVGPVTDDPAIVVGDNFFDADTLVVAAGTEVTWTWDGRAVHDVAGPGFESAVMSEGSFVHQFDTPGGYPYVCTLHPGMEGVVYVVE